MESGSKYRICRGEYAILTPLNTALWIRRRYPRPGERVAPPLQGRGFVPSIYFEAAASAAWFCSSFAITSPTLKLAGFCLGGNSASVFIHCITMAAAGMSM